MSNKNLQGELQTWWESISVEHHTNGVLIKVAGETMITIGKSKEGGY